MYRLTGRLTHAETRRKENLMEPDEITGAIVDPSVKRNLPVGRLINNLLFPPPRLRVNQGQAGGPGT